MKRLVVIGLMCLAVTGVARTAAAQDDPSKVEISGGWQYSALRSNDSNDWTHFEKGWYGEGAFHVKGFWSVVAQVSGMYETLPDNSGGPDVKVKVHPYLFGVRGTSRRNPTAAAFAHFLVGMSNVKVRQGSDSESDNLFAYQVGGGANIPIGGRVGARVSADYIRMMPSDDSPLFDEAVHGFRLMVGITYGFGS